VAAGLALAWLTVAAFAPAGSAAEPSVEAPVAGSLLGDGPGAIVGVGPDLGARDPGAPLPGAAPARAAVGGAGGRSFERGRHSSRGNGFVRDARGFARIDVPGASFTAASGSNNRGQIVGDYLDARKRFHGFLREERRFRRIDFPGAEGTFAAAIDDRGRVVGSYTDERGTPAVRSAEHGFLRDRRGRFRRIDVPGARGTVATRINDRGLLADAVRYRLRRSKRASTATASSSWFEPSRAHN
jgi:hypothetical protein